MIAFRKSDLNLNAILARVLKQQQLARYGCKVRLKGGTFKVKFAPKSYFEAVPNCIYNMVHCINLSLFSSLQFNKNVERSIIQQIIKKLRSANL